MPRQAGHPEDPVDASLILAKFDPELLVLLAETLGNPLVLLISNAHLSKAFCEAARNAQGLFKHAELRLRADDAAVASVVSKCPQLSSLDLRYCRTITDVALRAVASSCPQLSSLSLGYCNKIADAAVAKGCPKLSSLDLGCCDMITDGAGGDGGLGLPAALVAPLGELPQHRRGLPTIGALGTCWLLVSQRIISHTVGGWQHWTSRGDGSCGEHAPGFLSAPCHVLRSASRVWLLLLCVVSLEPLRDAL